MPTDATSTLHMLIFLSPLPCSIGTIVSSGFHKKLKTVFTAFVLDLIASALEGRQPTPKVFALCFFC